LELIYFLDLLQLSLFTVGIWMCILNSVICSRYFKPVMDQKWLNLQELGKYPCWSVSPTMPWSFIPLSIQHETKLKK